MVVRWIFRRLGRRLHLGDRSILALTLVMLLSLGLPADARAEGRQPPPAPSPTLADVRYGTYDRNLLDVYRADTKNPAPALIYFHGGGWVGGDKKQVQPAPYLDAGITVISANYRFTRGTPDAAPYPACLHDAARVVQYVRSQAANWNIDPQRIAVGGSSAGANMSMWIAYRDDMADPTSDDPVARISTRITCLLDLSGPTIFDPAVILKRVGGNPKIHPALYPLFDVTTVEELSTDQAKRALAIDASPMTHVSADDPPTCMVYGNPLGETPLPATAPYGQSIHHTEFGVILKERLDELKVENILQYPGSGLGPDTALKFLIRHLKPEPPAGR